MRRLALLAAILALCSCSGNEGAAQHGALPSAAAVQSYSGAAIPARPLPPPVDSGLRRVVKHPIGSWKVPAFVDAARHAWLHGAHKMRPHNIILTDDHAGQYGLNLHVAGTIGGTAVQVVNPSFQLPYNTYVWYAPTMRPGDPSCLEATVDHDRACDDEDEA
jgi:hypothetical protein